MASSFVGQSSISNETVLGRASLGIEVDVNLSVDVSTDLAVDEFADLVVVKGVIWTGATSVQSISCGGSGAATWPWAVP
jgi:hypothetical protein